MERGKLLSFQVTNKGAVLTHTSNDLEEGEITTKTHKIIVDRKPSEKLTMALRTLLTHALLKCELTEGKIKDKEVNSRKAVDMPAFKGYCIDSFTISGDDEEEKVSISVTKVLSDGDKFSFKVPPIRIENKNNPFEIQLAEDLDTVIKECWDYEAGKNYYVQGELFKNPEAEVKVPKDDDEEI